MQKVVKFDSSFLLAFYEYIRRNLLKIGKYSLIPKFRSSKFESIDELGKLTS